MRLTSFALLVLLSACGPGVDPLVGAFQYSLTGVDSNTSPNTSTTAVTGVGTVSINASAATASGGNPQPYLVALTPGETLGCVLNATPVNPATDPELKITPGQTCLFPSGGGGSATATITSAKAVVKLGTTRAGDTVTVTAAYSYAYSFLGVNFAGTGTRTYTGSRR